MKIIKKDSDEAATYRTNISGWVDSHGYFYGEDEEAARRAGSTHSECSNCFVIIEKSDTLCDDCKERSEIERYNKREKVEWYRDDVLYSDKYNVYFFSIRDIITYANDSVSEFDLYSLDDLRLILCEKVFLRNIEIDLWWGELDEDVSDDVIPILQDALDDFNTDLNEIDTKLWEPGAYRVSFYDRIDTDRVNND